jgi:hypothetical protein
MICPLSMAYDGENQKCERSYCAWWNDDGDCCSIVTIAINSAIIVDLFDPQKEMGD